MVEYLSHYILTVLQICANIYFAHLFFKNGKVGRMMVAAVLASLPIPPINALGNMALNFLSAYWVLFIALRITFQQKVTRLAAMSLVICVLNFIVELLTLLMSSLIFGSYTQNIIEENINNAIYAFIVLLVFFTITCLLKIAIDRWQAEQPLVFSSNSRVVLLPVMTIIVGYYIMYAGECEYNENLSIIGLIIFILLIAVNIAMLFSAENERKKHELKATLATIRLQEEYNAEAIRQMEKSQQEFAKQAHDFKYHLISIEEMIQTQKQQYELDAAGEYVQSLLNDIDTPPKAGGANIQNTALRVMVNRLKNQCEEQGIELSTDIRYSDFSFMRFQDICSFFANAFDNALWACGQISEMTKTIEVIVKKWHNIVHIKVTNTYLAPVVKWEWRFLSQKGEIPRTGIGTQNMKRSVERYGGSIEWEQGENRFSVIAIVPISRPDEPNIR